MSKTSEFPYPPQPGGFEPEGGVVARPAPGRGLLASVAVLAGSGVLGLGGGLAWALLAPRVAYQVVGRGSADAINPETSGFIAADAWFCVIGVACGLIIGLAGYLYAVRRYGPVPMVAIGADSVGAALLARYVGQSWGLSQFNHQLLTSPNGTVLHAPLVLGGDTSAILWPAIGFWPLAACLTAGALVLMFSIRGH